MINPESKKNYHSCLNKQGELKKKFASCFSKEEKYQKIIELGKCLPQMSSEFKKEENVVQGCQSLVYLYSFLENGKLKFEIASEALISSGLAALLIYIYQGESPEVVLKCPPKVLEELEIPTNLTPGRSNGLASIYFRMKQDALKFLI